MGVFRRSPLLVPPHGPEGLPLTTKNNSNDEEVKERTVIPLNVDVAPSKTLILRGGSAAGTSADVAEKALHPSGIMGIMSELATWIGATSFRCWMILLMAILVEIKATTLTKTASDTKDPMKMVTSLSMYLFSLILFAASLPKIEVSIAYAVWSGLGTALVSIAGITMFGESCDMNKIISLSLIMLGVVGLNIQGGGAHH